MKHKGKKTVTRRGFLAQASTVFAAIPFHPLARLAFLERLAKVTESHAQSSFEPEAFIIAMSDTSNMPQMWSSPSYAKTAQGSLFNVIRTDNFGRAVIPAYYDVDGSNQAAAPNELDLGDGRVSRITHSFNQYFTNSARQNWLSFAGSISNSRGHIPASQEAIGCENERSNFMNEYQHRSQLAGKLVSASPVLDLSSGTSKNICSWRHPNDPATYDIPFVNVGRTYQNSRDSVQLTLGNIPTSPALEGSEFAAVADTLQWMNNQYSQKFLGPASRQSVNHILQGAWTQMLDASLGSILNPVLAGGVDGAQAYEFDQPVSDYQYNWNLYFYLFETLVVNGAILGLNIGAQSVDPHRDFTLDNTDPFFEYQKNFAKYFSIFVDRAANIPWLHDPSTSLLDHVHMLFAGRRAYENVGGSFGDGPGTHAAIFSPRLKGGQVGDQVLQGTPGDLTVVPMGWDPQNPFTNTVATPGDPRDISVVMAEILGCSDFVRWATQTKGANRLFPVVKV